MTSNVKPSAALWFGLLAGLALAAFVLTLAACGGNDDDEGASEPTSIASADEAAYLEALESALQAVNAQLDGLDELRADAFDDGPNPAAAFAYGEGYETFMLDRLAAIEAITPSESLSDEHQALVSAASDGTVLAKDLRAKLGESPPANDAEFLELFGSLAGATITSRYLDACTKLQTGAASGGLDVDLQCLL